jgi:hypothetical protein
MARGNSRVSNPNSTIRFVMLEANLGDGDFSQITTAITNALRQPATPTQRLLTPFPRADTVQTSRESDSSIEEQPEIEEELGDVSTASRNESRVRKYRSPRVVQIDLSTEPSFTEFATAKNPSNDQKRFLVVAAWFKQARGVDEISMDQVYTCYRAVKWPSSIEDFDAPLRALKKRQLMDKGKGRGMYAINHLGIAEVDALGGGNAD